MTSNIDKQNLFMNKNLKSQSKSKVIKTLKVKPTEVQGVPGLGLNQYIQSQYGGVDKLIELRDNIMEQHKLSGDNNNLNSDDIFRMLDLYFYKEFYTYRHLHDSYDKFIDDTVPKFFTDQQHVISEILTENKFIRHKIVFANVRAEPPKLSNNIDHMFPADARHLAMPYSMIIYADMTQVKETTDINSSGKQHISVQVVGRTEHNRPVMIVPTMVRSKYCNLNIHKEETRDECKYDPGGYFIINGSEKIVICQDRMIHNSPMVFVKKNSNVSFFVVQVNSKSPTQPGVMQSISIKIKKDNVMIAKVPILYEVNVMILFRALGVESDRDIIEYCAYDKSDYHMIELIRTSLDNCVNDNDGAGEKKIQTQEEAIDYLISKMRVLKKYSEGNPKTKQEQKKLHLMELLKTSFLPHIEGRSNNPYREKAYYLGYMINRLLEVQLKRRQVDNRDSYCKKRVDNIRELFEEIMLQQYKNNISECNKQFTNRMGDNMDSAEPYNIIHQFKASIFEQGFKASLMLGNWPRKKGVSQMLQRFSYMQLISFLSRVDSQSGTQSSSKLMKPRHVDPSSVPFLCCVTGDTEILLSDNATVVRIKDLCNGKMIQSVNRSSLKEIKTSITNFFSRPCKNEKELLEITTISGRILKCTIDHPILTRNENGENIMIDAGELKVSDKIIVRHTEKYLEIDKPTVVIIDSKNVKNEILAYKLNILKYTDNQIPQYNLEVLARLIGTSIITGCIDNSNSGVVEFVLSEKMDTDDMFNDINALGFGSSTISQCDAFYKLTHGDAAFASVMIQLGAVVKNEIKEDRTVPRWILNGNNRIKREFLSGFSGSNGFKSYGQGDLVKNYCFGYMTDIKNMFKEFEIDGKIYESIEDSSVYFCPMNECIETFSDYIGFRYCSKKKRDNVFDNELFKCKKNGHSFCSETFYLDYYLDNFNMAIPIKSIKTLPPETVYDFTTISDTHTFIANGMVVSNCVQTPEHAKVGLIKHLSMIGSLTIGDRDNTELVKEFITTYPGIKRVYEVPVHRLKSMFKIFLDGEWLGVIENSYKVGNSYADNPTLKFYGDAKVRKLTGAFNPQMTSIAFDHKENQIRFCTDSGRLYRPVIRVNGDNELMLTKDMIDKISLKATDTDKIFDWDEFYMQAPYPIEFIDSEEQPYMMVAEDKKALNDERVKILGSLNFKFDDEESKIVNRYDDKFFNRYDCMEIHPSVLVGEIVTNIPFCNRNQAPRNLFQYAQGKQGMGIYCTSYRSRTDISFVLYNPEVPMVNTRTSKYTCTDVLPPGSNAVVAIACYSGFNQEDSLVLNMTSLQRGLFRSMSLKKYTSSITKNQETSGDDKFMKPPPDKTVGIKNGQYDKMNEKGFIPEETQITNGDVIFGKVTPINDATNSGKIFKDSSEQYKSHADGVVDRVYTGIKNQDGYETRKALIRSERFPFIGDKMCCYDPDHEVLTTEGWVKIGEVTLQHKVASLVNGDTLVYVNPVEVQSYDYEGKMYVVDSEQVKLRVTPNHRMWVATVPGKDKPKVYRIQTAEQCYGIRRHYKKNVEKYIPPNITNKYINLMRQFVLPGAKGLPEIALDMKSFLTLMGIWYAEGSTDGFVVQIATDKQRVKDDLDNVCGTMGFDVRKNISKRAINGKEQEFHNWRIRDPRLFAFFGPLSVGAVKKRLPRFVWDLTQKEADWLLKGMLQGDGHVVKAKEKGYTETSRYDTSSFELASDFQMLCLHAGDSSNIGIKYFAGHQSVLKAKGREGEIITSTVDAYRMSRITGQNNPKVNKDKQCDKWEKYDGKVYCCTVPTDDGVIYVRYQGHPVWCGNSRHGQKGTIGIALPNIDMPFTKYGIRPDIIMNPNAVPSRMTIGQLWECLLGKIGAISGMNMDGTAFEDYDLNALKDSLESLGYQRECEEYMYNGMTGKKIKHMIFIGPTFYQRLKHMVQDKMHCLTSDHMVQTLDGWKMIEDIKFTDQIVVEIDGQRTHTTPTHIYRYTNSRNKIINLYYNDYTVVQRMTNEHRVYVSLPLTKNNKIVWSDFKLVEMADLIRWCKIKDPKGQNQWNKGSLNVRMKDGDGKIIKGPFHYTISDSVDPVHCLSVKGDKFIVMNSKNYQNGKLTQNVWTGNSRARGPVTILTKQAPEGRSKDGGLRLGEMERDALIAHGVAKFLKERLMDCSDPYSTYVCGICGLFARREDSRKNLPTPGPDDTHYCPMCNNYSDIHQIMIPYAFKLMIQELMAMNIAPRIRVQKHLSV